MNRLATKITIHLHTLQWPIDYKSIAIEQFQALVGWYVEVCEEAVVALYVHDLL